MTTARAHSLTMLAFAALGAELYFRDRYLYIAVTSASMLLLAVGAIAVGQIPRRVRTKRNQIVCWIIGWPIFITNLAMMVVSCCEMFVLNAPEWVLVFAFFWVLAYLTWKVFIDPNSGPGGWWRRGSGQRPKGHAPRPVNRGLKPTRDAGAAVLAGLPAKPVSALTEKSDQPWQ